MKRAWAHGMSSVHAQHSLSTHPPHRQTPQQRLELRHVGSTTWRGVRVSCPFPRGPPE